MQLSLKYRVESLDFNNLADKMLLERERQYTENGIQRTARSACCLDVTTKFIPQFEHNELGGHNFDEVDDEIGNPNYVPGI